MLAILLPPWIDYVRPRTLRTKAQWPVAALGAALMLVIVLAMYLNQGMYAPVRTLQETFLALTLLLLYVQPLRRPSARAAVATAVMVALVACLLELTSAGGFVTEMAESVLMLILVPLLVDLADRAVLTPSRPSPLRWRQGFLALMVVVPLVFIVLRQLDLPVPVARHVVVFVTRAQEGFVGVFLIGLYYLLRDWAGGARGAVS